MSKIGIIFGSDTGNTEDVVKKLAVVLGEKNFDLIDVANTNVAEFSSYDKLILASSTWGDGDLQADWELFEEELEEINFKDKTVALIGLGDQEGYEDTFCNSMALLHEKVSEAKIIGQTSIEGYEFSESDAVIDGQFIGLAIDEMNQDDLTQGRLEKWAEQIKGDLGL